MRKVSHSRHGVVKYSQHKSFGVRDPSAWPGSTLTKVRRVEWASRPHSQWQKLGLTDYFTVTPEAAERSTLLHRWGVEPPRYDTSRGRARPLTKLGAKVSPAKVCFFPFSFPSFAWLAFF